MVTYGCFNFIKLLLNCVLKIDISRSCLSQRAVFLFVLPLTPTAFEAPEGVYVSRCELRRLCGGWEPPGEGANDNYR